MHTVYILLPGKRLKYASLIPEGEDSECVSISVSQGKKLSNGIVWGIRCKHG